MYTGVLYSTQSVLSKYHNELYLFHSIVLWMGLLPSNWLPLLVAFKKNVTSELLRKRRNESILNVL